MIQQNFIDLEKLIDLMKTKDNILDIENAKELRLTRGGEIKFGINKLSLENVCFSYNERNVINNLSFLIL